MMEPMLQKLLTSRLIEKAEAQKDFSIAIGIKNVSRFRGKPVTESAASCGRDDEKEN